MDAAICLKVPKAVVTQLSNVRNHDNSSHSFSVLSRGSDETGGSASWELSTGGREPMWLLLGLF